MTVTEAINEVDNLKPNDYGSEEKIKWLQRLDQQLKQEICDTHEYNDSESAPDVETAYTGDTVLLVPSPYDELYVHYLAAQIDYYNREYDAFNATNVMFVTCYNSFRNRYNSTHRPLTAKKVYY